MRFDSIVLRNFQAHTDRKVEFSPRITTIVGPSDVGKSAILRALRWACLNDFAGDDFVHWNAKQALVVVRVREGKNIFKIGRGRGRPDGNIYTLDDEEFKSLGQGGVPGPIAKLLKIGELNFQSQHDAPFWFSQRAAEVSRQLNKVIDLSVIDTSLSYIATEVRRAQDRVAFAEELLEKHKAELDQVDRKRLEDFDCLLSDEEYWKNKQRDSNKLDGLIQRINSNQAEALQQKATATEALFLTAKTLWNIQEDVRILEGLVHDLEETDTKAKGPPDFEPVQQAFTKWTELKEDIMALETLSHKLENTERQLQDALILQAKQEKQYHNQIKGQRCPLCQQNL